MENKIKHMEMIQGIINRMASNSFSLKGWAVTLVAAIFALAGQGAENVYYLITYIPIVIFWGLDSYYLLQERMYRSLYDKVRKMNIDDIDFSMNAYQMKGNGNNKFYKCVISKTELFFYLPLAVAVTIIIAISNIYV